MSGLLDGINRGTDALLRKNPTFIGQAADQLELELQVYILGFLIVPQHIGSER